MAASPLRLRVQIPRRWLLGSSVFVIVAVAASWATLSRAGQAFFYSDDYIGIQRDAGWLDSVFVPYGGHVVYTAAFVWDGWLAMFGTSSYTPFLLLAIGLTTASASLMFVVVGRMLGPLTGVAAATWVLFLGPAFHNQLWDQASLSLIALCALLAVALIGLRTSPRAVVALGIAVVGLGVGGLGVGVAIAFVSLALFERRWLLGTAMGMGTLLVGLASQRSLSPTPRGDESLVISLARIPMYLAQALQDVVGVSLALPAGIAGAVALIVGATVALGAWAVFRVPRGLVQRAFLLTTVYLTSTWALTAIVRGTSAEAEGAAVPRYLGITGPALLVATLSALVLIARVGQPTLTVWVSTHRTGLRVGAGIVIVVAAVGNLPLWLQARANVSYLGATNLARLALMHAGSPWIDPAFTPPGEGLAYIRQGPIESAWIRRGVPLLDIEALRRQGPQPGIDDAYLDTAIAAGAFSVTPRVAAPVHHGRCRSVIRLPADHGGRILFFGAPSTVAVNIGISTPRPLSVSTPSGLIHARPLLGAGTVVIRAASGCLMTRDR